MKNKILLLVFILIFSIPRSLQEIKIIFFLFLLLFSFNNKILKSFYIITISYSLIFLLPLFVGLYYNNSILFITTSLKLNLFFPILLLFLLQNFTTESITLLLIKSSKISILIIVLLALSTILNGLGFFPYNLNLIFYPNETALRLEGGYVQVINSSLTQLLFIVPIYFVNSNNKITIKNLLAFILLFIFCFVTGRRILLLPFLLIIFFNIKKFILPLIIISIFMSLFSINDNEYFNKEIIYNRFYDAINSEGDSYVRQEQSNEFNFQIAQKPIFGSGLGAFMKNYIRNEDFPIAYEKTYHYLIFSYGIPIFFMLLLFYIFLMYCVYRNSNMFENNINFIIAIFSLLLASLTNPYWLSSFDYVLPLSLLMRFSQNHVTVLYQKFNSYFSRNKLETNNI